MHEGPEQPETTVAAATRRGRDTQHNSKSTASRPRRATQRVAAATRRGHHALVSRKRLAAATQTMTVETECQRHIEV